MSVMDRFAAYAAAFEQTYVDDDWSRLEQFFTDDAVYETVGDPPFAGAYEGRDALLAQLENSVDSLDRKFDSRTLEMTAPPEEHDGEVVVPWIATYAKAGLPDLRIGGTERAVFDGDRIARLVDTFTPDSGPALMAWMAEHGAALG